MNNTYNEKMIGKNLKRIRQNASNPMSQLDFALEIGISDSVIGKIERGLRYPTVEIITAYMDMFHVDANAIFDNGDGEHSYYESIDLRLQELDEETRMYLLSVFNRMLSFHTHK